MHESDVVLGRYGLVRPIGGGASCTVWAADGPGGERVAVKALSLEEAGWRAEVRDRFMREAEVLRRVQSPHLVRVLDVGETDEGQLLLVLELLEGETLAERIARPPRLDWREAAQIAIGIAKGALALHEAQVVHRDLKPGNVVLRKRESEPPLVTLIDLGISKVRRASPEELHHATLTATGQLLGTPEYMSYEQALGDRDIDARSDVWAIGVMLYEMVTGRSPFAAANTNAILAAIRKSRVAPIARIGSGAPSSLASLVGRCIEPRREKRVQSARELIAALEAALADRDASMAPAADADAATGADPTEPAPDAADTEPAAQSPSRSVELDRDGDRDADRERDPDGDDGDGIDDGDDGDDGIDDDGEHDGDGGAPAARGADHRESIPGAYEPPPTSTGAQIREGQAASPIAKVAPSRKGRHAFLALAVAIVGVGVGVALARVDAAKPAPNASAPKPTPSLRDSAEIASVAPAPIALPTASAEAPSVTEASASTTAGSSRPDAPLPGPRAPVSGSVGTPTTPRIRVTSPRRPATPTAEVTAPSAPPETTTKPLTEVNDSGI